MNPARYEERAGLLQAWRAAENGSFIDSGRRHRVAVLLFSCALCIFYDVFFHQKAEIEG